MSSVQEDRKKLKEILKEIPNEIVYIGAATGFIYCNKSNEYYATIKLKRKQQTTNRNTIVDSLAKIKHYEEEILKCEKKISETIKSNKEIRENLRLMETFWDREVRETYPHLTEPKGTVILVEGDENSRFWTYDEYISGKPEQTFDEYFEEDEVLDDN